MTAHVILNTVCVKNNVCCYLKTTSNYSCSLVISDCKFTPPLSEKAGSAPGTNSR